MKFKSLFLYYLFFIFTVHSSSADTWLRADVYFIDWDVVTRCSLTPKRIREICDYKKTFRNNASEIVDLLKLEMLQPAKERHPEDARLVVDLITDTGARVTYYASGFSLCTEDNSRKRPIDNAFRRRFEKMMKK